MYPSILDPTDATRSRRSMRTLQKIARERIMRRRALALLDQATADAPAGTSPAPQRMTCRAHRLSKIPAGSYDPRFERPDLVEDDYYRFRNAPRGW